MYKIPDLPSPRANINDLTDFAEVECFVHKNFSKQEFISCLNIYSDDFIDERATTEENIELRVDEAFQQIELRAKLFKNKYPFELDENGTQIKLKPIDEKYYYLYLYLLLCTRFRMSLNNVQNEIDGALLFEKLSEQIALCYFGNRAESFLMGTSSETSSFEEKINRLTKLLDEGKGYKNEDEDGAKYQKDDNLDLVVWKSFYDKYPGKLIGFGQCKTGTSWQDKLTSIQPDKFCETWFISTPIVTPVRLFFISDYVSKERWIRSTRKAGILFDRFRIADFSDNILTDVIDDLKRWTDGALKFLIAAIT